MSKIFRTPKSGDEWTDNDLEAYNISIAFQDAQTFFGKIPSLPTPVHRDYHKPPSIYEDILIALTADEAYHQTTYRLLSQLDIAMTPSESGELAICDFAVALFQSLGYLDRPRAICSRKVLPFLICGVSKSAKPDICIIDRNANDVILLVREDKRFGGGINLHGQLVAEAIAAFQNNNARRRSVGLDPITSKVIPGIILTGTSPCFFKIPVTQELATSVGRGLYPPTPTIVTGHVPDILRPNRRISEGMIPLDNRRAILSSYEAFKKFVF